MLNKNTLGVKKVRGQLEAAWQIGMYDQKRCGQVTKSIIVVTICYKLLCHSSRFLISNFLASTDINVFGRTYLFAMLLLIGLALFLHPGCFCLLQLHITHFLK